METGAYARRFAVAERLDRVLRSEEEERRRRSISRGRDGDEWAAIDVADDGPGIPAEWQERVFLEFERSSESRGSGVGSTISRRIARALGGDLTVESGPASGTVFTVLVRPPRVHEPGH